MRERFVRRFKDRGVNPEKPVQIYRNLNGDRLHRWSIRQGGLVVAHAEEIELEDVSFHVNRAGWRRMAKSGRRNVHAYAKGWVVRPRRPFWAGNYLIRVVYDRFEGRFKNVNVYGSLWAGTTVTSGYRAYFADSLWVEQPNVEYAK